MLLMGGNVKRFTFGGPSNDLLRGKSITSRGRILAEREKPFQM
jgi:hypothetical protein